MWRVRSASTTDVYYWRDRVLNAPFEKPEA